MLRPVIYNRPDLCSSYGFERERWTPYSIKQPDAFLQIQGPPFHIARKPLLGPSNRFPERQASGKRVTSSWRYRHTELSTENYPTRQSGISAGIVRIGLEQVTRRENHNPPHEFCRDCIQKHRDERCEWANVELSPARFYRELGTTKSLTLGLLLPALYPLSCRRTLSAVGAHPASTQ